MVHAKTNDFEDLELPDCDLSKPEGAWETTVGLTANGLAADPDDGMVLRGCDAVRSEGSEGGWVQCSGAQLSTDVAVEASGRGLSYCDSGVGLVAFFWVRLPADATAVRLPGNPPLMFLGDSEELVRVVIQVSGVEDAFPLEVTYWTSPTGKLVSRESVTAVVAG